MRKCVAVVSLWNERYASLPSHYAVVRLVACKVSDTEVRWLQAATVCDLYTSRDEAVLRAAYVAGADGCVVDFTASPGEAIKPPDSEVATPIATNSGDEPNIPENVGHIEH